MGGNKSKKQTGSLHSNSSLRDAALERIKLRQMLLDESTRSSTCSDIYMEICDRRGIMGKRHAVCSSITNPEPVGHGRDKLQRRSLSKQPHHHHHSSSSRHRKEKTIPYYEANLKSSLNSHRSYEEYNEEEELPEMDYDTPNYPNRSNNVQCDSNSNTSSHDERNGFSDSFGSSHLRSDQQDQCSHNNISITNGRANNNHSDSDTSNSSQLPPGEFDNRKVEHKGPCSADNDGQHASTQNTRRSSHGNLARGEISNNSNMNNKGSIPDEESQSINKDRRRHLHRRSSMPRNMGSRKNSTLNKFNKTNNNDDRDDVNNKSFISMKDDYVTLKKTLAELQSQLVLTQSQVHKYTTMMNQAQEAMQQLKARNVELEKRNAKLEGLQKRNIELKKENSHVRKLLEELKQRQQYQKRGGFLKKTSALRGPVAFAENNQDRDKEVIFDNTRHNASEFLWSCDSIGDDNTAERKLRLDSSVYTPNSHDEIVSISSSISKSSAANNIEILLQDFPTSNDDNNNNGCSGSAEERRQKKLSTALADTIRKKRRSSSGRPRHSSSRKQQPSKKTVATFEGMYDVNGKEIPQYVQCSEDDLSDISSYRGRRASMVGRGNLERKSSIINLLKPPWQK